MQETALILSIFTITKGIKEIMFLQTIVTNTRHETINFKEEATERIQPHQKKSTPLFEYQFLTMICKIFKGRLL